jgi:hypothetical protein
VEITPHLVRSLTTMANPWDDKIKGFLKKTGEDFRRAGNDIKVEAQKLMKEVQDPAGQAKIKEGLKDFGGWAKKTAVEVAELAETGFKKAEGAFRQAGENWKPPEGGEPGQAGAEAASPTPTPPSEPPEMEGAAPPEAPAEPAAPKKTIGKKKPAGTTAKPKAGAKKTMGKKPPP